MKNFLDFCRVNIGEARSAWDRAVNADALGLVYEHSNDPLPESRKALETLLLNGAKNWHEYSWGGCALAYDEEIAERYCTPSEYKKKKGGNLRPNRAEEWLDVQARALAQAFVRVRWLYNLYIKQ